jgi:hypothetical protein
MFLFVIPVCVVLTFWQWKNDLIPCLHFIFGILEMEKRFFCDIHVWVVLVSWQWKNEIISLSAFL